MFKISFNFLRKIKKYLFPFYKNKELIFVFKKIQENFPSEKVAARFVGGCVRKYLTNENIDDIDVATILSTKEIKEKFKNTNFQVIETGIEHGTITLVSKKLKIELTTLRKDKETDGRHAEVEFIDDWKLDSERRDFTINAIYLDIKGKIFDPQLGVKDLKNLTVKFIGDPYKRIEEDYLRIIRFIRFSLDYESEIESKTIEAIKLNINGIKKISKDRILIELFKILDTRNFTKLNNNKYLREIFLLIFPELKNLDRLDRLNKISNQFNFDSTTLLAILLIDKTNNHEYFSHKYNISNNLKKNLQILAKNFINLNGDKNFFIKDLKKNFFYFGKEHLITLNQLNYSNNNQIKLKDYLNTFKTINTLVLPKFPFDGNFLKNKGIKEGRKIGKMLKLIEEDWLDNGFKISDQRISKIINDEGN